MVKITQCQGREVCVLITLIWVMASCEVMLVSESSTAPYVHSTSNVLRALQIFELTIEFVKVKENYYKTSALYSMRKLFRFFNQWVLWVEKSRTFGTESSHKMQQSCPWWLPPVLVMLLSSVKKLSSPQLLIIYPILVCNKVYCQSYTWTNISVAQNNLHRSSKLERCRWARESWLSSNLK